uniref:Potassium channel domain-containing protein n=1 Tax=Panagrolaimus sp. ES5 TaxID=591445 RepID=A0AC34F0V6_9BILA
MSFKKSVALEGLFSSSAASRPDGSWDTNDLLTSNHSGKDDFITSDENGKDSDDESEERGFRKYAKLILPHVGLVLLTCAYTLIGASIFYSFENPNELATKRQQLNLLYLRQEQFVSSVLQLAENNETDRKGMVGFGDLMPRRDQYMYLILSYIILGLAITTMCIDLVGVQYIRKIHYFGRKIQDARSALAVVGGKVVLVSELYANLMQKRARNGARDAFIIENLYVSKHIIPFIPSDIRWIRYIDQNDQASMSSSSSLELHSCRFCHSRFSISISHHP